MNFVTQSTFTKNKTQTLALPLATIAFTLLFHQSDIGLNLALFDIAMVVFLIMTKPESFKKTEVKIAVLLTLITAFCTAWYGTPDNIIWSIVCLGLLSQLVLYPQTSVLLLETRLMIASLISPIMRFSELFNPVEPNTNTPKSGKREKVIRIIFVVILPLIFTLIFAGIYRQMNPYFDNFCKEIEVYINFEVLLTAALGLYICTVFLKAFVPDEIIKTDQKLQNVFTAEGRSNPHLKLEMQSGIALFSMLNLTLIIYLISDVMFLQTIHLQGTVDHSKYVHQGIGMLIVSILLATAFILYFFRGSEASKLPVSSWLKRLALLWVVANMSILITTAIKNYLYIDEYALTIKRIGVFIYLLCAIAGLMIAFAKVHQGKTNAFLFRKTYWAFLIILTANLCMDWSTIIVKHNLKAHIENGQTLDWRYLLRMDNRTLPLINEKIGQLELNVDEYDSLKRELEAETVGLIGYQPKLREIVISDIVAQQKLNHYE